MGNCMNRPPHQALVSAGNESRIACFLPKYCAEWLTLKSRDQREQPTQGPVRWMPSRVQCQTIIRVNETHCGNREKSRIRPRSLPRHHWPGQEKPDSSPEEKDFHSRRCGGCCLLNSERQSAAHRCFEDRQGSHNRHIEPGEFLRRRLAGRPGSANGIRGGNDRLPDSAD